MWTKMSERVAKFGRRFRKSEGGATAVEFALVAFPFISLLGITMETGLLMFTEYTLQASVQDAARLIRTGQAQSAAMSASAFKAKICSTASLIIDCTGGVTVYVRSDPTFAALRAALPVFTNVGSSSTGTPNPTSYSCGGPLQAAAVVATYDWNFSMPGMNYLGNMGSANKRRLVGFAMFQNEPFPAGSTC